MYGQAILTKQARLATPTPCFFLTYRRSRVGPKQHMYIYIYTSCQSPVVGEPSKIVELQEAFKELDELVDSRELRG